MKKTRFVAAALCLAVMALGSTSCKKNNGEKPTNNGEKITINAAIEQNNDDGTKTYLVPINAGNTEVRWSEGDQIKLFGTGGNQPSNLTLSEGDANKTTAKFYGDKPDGSTPYYAVYPTGGRFNGSTFTFDITDLSYSSAEFNNTQKFDGPMVAKSTDGQNLAFKNAMSALYIGLKGDAKISKIVLVDMNLNKSGSSYVSANNPPLKGTLTVTLNSDGTVSTSMSGEDNHELTLDLGNGVQLNEDTYSRFCFPIPEGAFKGNNSKNLRIHIYDQNNNLISAIIEGISGNGVVSNTAYLVEKKDVDALPYVKPEILNGEFSVGNSKTVKFTRGNLYCTNNTNKTFKLEDEQWNVGETSYVADHVSHFFWNSDATKAASNSAPSSTPFGAKNFPCNANGTTINDDFTVEENDNGYRILTSDQFTNLMNRKDGTNYLRAMGKVNSVTGLILLPDDWNDYASYYPNFKYGSTSCSDNVFSVEAWKEMEYHGAVFLPIAGAGTKGAEINRSEFGAYWTCYFISNSNSKYAYYFTFQDGKSYSVTYSNGTSGNTTSLDKSYKDWFSIRLVKDI